MIYEENNHTSEVITIPATRYRINEEPTCASWVGCKDHPQEVCKFLLTSHFGQRYQCGLSGLPLNYIDTTLTPDKECPLWKHRPVNEFKEGDKVWVWDEDIEEGERRYFFEFEAGLNFPYKCYAFGDKWTSTDNWDGFQYCKKWKGE